MDRTKQDHPVSALLVGAYEKDRLLVHETFRNYGWRLFEARDRRKAIHCLERNVVHVVIAETEIPEWHWKKVLDYLRKLAQPPQLIVTSHHADDYLWAEALNFGAYDVLPQPFEKDELTRVIASARRHFDRDHLRESSQSAGTARVA
jgi:DNA-binding NtrC family response regulator